MVNSSYKQHVQVVDSPKASPVYIDGSNAGRVKVGAGNISTPQAARPAYLQYMPAPTSYGAKTGEMVGNLTENINKMTLQIADAEAKNTAALKSSADRALLHQLAYEGADGNGGILTKSGAEFLSLRKEAETQMHQLIAASSAEMEDNVRSYYVADMQKHAKVIKSQMDSKYLIEFADVEAEARKRDQADSMANALAVSHKPKEAMSFVFENYKQRVLAKGGLTEDDIMGGKTDPDAMNDAVLEFAEGLIAAPGNSHRLEPYLETLNGLLKPSGQKKLIKLLQTDVNLKLKNLKDHNDTLDERAAETWNSIQAKTGATLVKAKAEGKLLETVSGMKDSLIIRPGGDYLAKQVTAMYNTLKTPTEGVTPPLKTTAWLAESAAKGVPPMEIPLAAEAKKLTLDSKSMEKYVTSYESKLSINVAGIRSNLKDQLGAYVEDSKGITAGEQGFFLTTPAGKAWVAKIMENSTDRLEETYRSAKGGASGRKAARAEASTILKEVQSGQWNPSMVTVTKNLVDEIPKEYSVLNTIFPDTRATAALPNLYTGQSIDRVTDYVTSMSEEDVSAVRDVKFRAALKSAAGSPNFFEALSRFDGTDDPGLSALKFYKKLRLLQVASDTKLAPGTKTRYMRNIIDQTDVAMSRLIEGEAPMVKTPNYLKASSDAESVPTSRTDQILGTLRDTVMGTN